MASWAAIASKDAEASPIQTINWKEDKPATAVVDANAIISGLRLPGGVQRAVTIQVRSAPTLPPPPSACAFLLSLVCKTAIGLLESVAMRSFPCREGGRLRGRRWRAGGGKRSDALPCGRGQVGRWDRSGMDYAAIGIAWRLVCYRRGGCCVVSLSCTGNVYKHCGTACVYLKQCGRVALGCDGRDPGQEVPRVATAPALQAGNHGSKRGFDQSR